ncbi:MAG: YitT family protein [Verrucomicrobia bacterium]|nr:YitT family protein [Verrucomicrobiota bacterium]
MYSIGMKPRTLIGHIIAFLWTAVGAFLVAVALKCFLAPAHLIDGGVVGISMIFSSIFGQQLLPYFLIILNLPFILLALKQVGKRFVGHMLVALFLLAVWSFVLEWTPPFQGDVLEVIVFGGLLLGIGTGLVIRMGGALDGTEILAIIVSRNRGYTVGQVVFFLNIFIFAISGLVESDYHSALRSFMTYIIAYKIMDTVIVGLDETKAVRILSAHSEKLAKKLVHELGLGVTVLYGRGGYSGNEQEMLYVIVERLQLAELKALVLREDPKAFIAIENLHEVLGGQGDGKPTRKKRKRRSLLS